MSPASRWPGRVLQFELDGLPVRVNFVGGVADTGRPTFVMVHGLGVSSLMFADVARTLAEHGRVVLFDLPGAGGLPRPPGPLTIEGLAALTRYALDELGIDECVLIGHSMGAQIAVEMRARQSSASSATLLVAPVADPRDREVPWALRRFLRSAVHEDARNAVVSVRAYLKSGAWWIPTLLPEILRYPMERRIRRVRGTITIVRGNRDYLCTSRWANRLKRAAIAADRVHLRVIRGAAHQVVVGDAGRVAQAALALARVTGCR